MTTTTRSFSTFNKNDRLYRVKANGRQIGWVAPAIGRSGWVAYTMLGERIATQATRAHASGCLFAG